ncbi:glycosyl hydrolase family 95 catalytic domain-containing protein [Streptococcus pluranimalium]
MKKRCSQDFLNKHYRYSIRKLGIGVASVAIGLSFLGLETLQVKASENIPVTDTEILTPSETLTIANDNSNELEGNLTSETILSSGIEVTPPQSSNFEMEDTAGYSKVPETEMSSNILVSSSQPSSELINNDIQVDNKVEPDLTNPIATIEETNTNLYYSQPAATTYEGWEHQALPLGNGDIGTKVFGLIGEEKIQYNEKSLWSGGPMPDDDSYNGGNYEDRYLVLPEIRKALEEGNLVLAKSLAETNLVGPYNQQYGRYLAFGDIFIDFTNQAKDFNSVLDYERKLDISRAINTISYRQDGTKFIRESFVSYPDDLAVMHLTQEGEKLLDFEVTMRLTKDMVEGGLARVRQFTDEVSPYKEGQVSYKDGGILLTGQVTDNHLQFASYLGIDTDGQVKTLDDRIRVTGATYATLLMNAATDFAQNPKTNYRRLGIDLTDEVVTTVEEGLGKPYEILKERHVSDYQSIYNRVQLNLTPEDNDVTTDQLLSTYQSASGQKLEELFFQYGRYLMITSSRDRENALPANLQGIWNAVDNPPWNSDYHLNVNLQMNYWPVYTTNMAEIAIPLINYVDDLRYYGRIAAGEYAGIVSREGEENGWLVHTQATPFGWTTPGWSYYWGWSPAANAWIMQNVYDYYRFTKDEDYLKEKIYPMLRETAKFWDQFLHYDETSKRYVSSPSYSPEHGTITIGNTFDQSLVWQLFNDFIEAANHLNEDQELVASIQEKFEKLSPLHINNAGQIKEWYEEDTPAFTAEYQGDPQHRHVSQLVGLFPGTLFSKDEPAYLEAAKATLDVRGDGGTGWSKANKINLWARLLDGNRAHRLLSEQLLGSTLENLWDTHSPFQIDGNFGATSGMAEMLLQSHLGYISPLPALPDAWETGQVRGLLARGNVTVDMDWENSNLKVMRLTSNVGGPIIVDYPSIEYSRITIDGQPVAFKVLKEGRIAIDSQRNDQIIFDHILGRITDLNVRRQSEKEALLQFSPVEDARYYVIERETLGQPSSIRHFTTDRAAFLDRTALSDYSYRYRVRPILGQKTIDFSNAIELTVVKTLIDDRDPSIIYGAAFDNWSDPDLWSSTEKFADVTGNRSISQEAVTANIPFIGTGIVIYGNKTDRLGKAQVYLDDQPMGEIDFYKEGASQKSVPIARYEQLSPGPHVLTLVVSRDIPTRINERNKISLDYFEVLSQDPGGYEVLDDRDARVIYGSAYDDWQDPQLYRGTEKFADWTLLPDATEGDLTATLDFEGVGIQVYGMKTNQLGQALVWIDGVLQDPLIFNHTTTEKGVLIGEYANLESGRHRLVLQVSPDAINGSRKKISLDKFVILKEVVEMSYPASLSDQVIDSDNIRITLPDGDWTRVVLTLPDQEQPIHIQQSASGIFVDALPFIQDGKEIILQLPENRVEGLIRLESYAGEYFLGEEFAYLEIPNDVEESKIGDPNTGDQGDDVEVPAAPDTDDQGSDTEVPVAPDNGDQGGDTDAPAAPGTDDQDGDVEVPVDPGTGDQDGDVEAPSDPDTGDQDSDVEVPADPDTGDPGGDTPVDPGTDDQNGDTDTSVAPGTGDQEGDTESPVAPDTGDQGSDTESPVDPVSPVDEPTDEVETPLPARLLHDLATGVRVQLQEGEDARIVSLRVTHKETGNPDTPAILGSHDYDLFDIVLVDQNGQVVANTKETLVYLPVDAGKRVARVVYLPNTEQEESLPFRQSTLTDATGQAVTVVIFTASHFSDYGIVYDSDVPVEDPVTEPETTVTDKGEPAYADPAPIFDLAAADDNDGFTNGQELAAGSDYQDPTSHPTLDAPEEELVTDKGEPAYAAPAPALDLAAVLEQLGYDRPVPTKVAKSLTSPEAKLGQRKAVAKAENSYPAALPNTGDASAVAFVVTGLAMSLLGFGLGIRKRED